MYILIYQLSLWNQIWKFLYLSILASAVRPAIVMPMCVSIGITFFWWADNSDEARFSAINTAWVLLFSPTVAEPNFTASMAYSTWWSLPWGLHTVTSLSYWLRNWKISHIQVFILWNCITRSITTCIYVVKGLTRPLRNIYAQNALVTSKI